MVLEEEKLFDQEPMPVNSPIEIDSATEIVSQDTNPPESEIGILGDDGYYWLEWPSASGLVVLSSTKRDNLELF